MRPVEPSASSQCGDGERCKSSAEDGSPGNPPFSAKHQCDGFTLCFERGLKALDHEPDGEGFHRDLYPGRKIPAVSDLLNACQHGWVFGGMGSWNDIGFDGAEGQEYNRVSEQLFRVIPIAITAAVEEHAAIARF